MDSFIDASKNMWGFFFIKFNRFNPKINTVKGCILDCHFQLTMQETGYMCTHLGYISFLSKQNRIPRVFLLTRHIEYSLLLFPNDIKLNICIGGIFVGFQIRCQK